MGSSATGDLAAGDLLILGTIVGLVTVSNFMALQFTAAPPIRFVV
ncbi:hypothetical protein ANAPH1_00657 [Anaplasma phagocytophilum]|nr:hypothetical protein ANAPH1_00657 [Anaplasma phagocytophilum]